MNSTHQHSGGDNRNDPIPLWAAATSKSQLVSATGTPTIWPPAFPPWETDQRSHRDRRAQPIRGAHYHRSAPAATPRKRGAPPIFGDWPGAKHADTL